MTKTYDDNNGMFNEVVLVDENGKEAKFDHVLTFLYEKERYIALLPLEDVEGLEDNEVLFMHVVTENGEDKYESVDNDILLDELFEEFLRLVDEMIDEGDDEE